ncbi:hypothetical protein CCZ27_02675 [Thauera sinica]|nr:hypothetical protein CCZ27_02675 [Thauera sp. K11]
MQWLRESMAALISLVILVLTASMMWMTFVAADATKEVKVPVATTAVPSDEAEKNARTYQTESYNRQKDIMLYALALLGTVTGYYLGRVPAEINAKRAENAADTAQRQLSRTQDRLADSAATVSAAQTELGQVKEQKAKVASAAKGAARALHDVRDTLATAQYPSFGPTGRGSLAGGAATAPASDAAMQQAIERIDAALRDIELETLG